MNNKCLVTNNYRFLIHDRIISVQSQCVCGHLMCFIRVNQESLQESTYNKNVHEILIHYFLEAYIFNVLENTMLMVIRKTEQKCNWFCE